jgi:DNA-binding NarL/FixJ family response regulator
MDHLPPTRPIRHRDLIEDSARSGSVNSRHQGCPRKDYIVDSSHPTRPIEHVRILLAEDPFFEEYLQGLLEPPFEIVGKVRDGRALLEAAPNLKPDVILTEIEMPILNGLDAVRELTKSGCHAKVIFLTIDSDLDLERAGLAAGASGYVVKDRVASDLIPAIRSVLAGHFFPSRTMK